MISRLRRQHCTYSGYHRGSLITLFLLLYLEFQEHVGSVFQYPFHEFIRIFYLTQWGRQQLLIKAWCETPTTHTEYRYRTGPCEWLRIYVMGKFLLISDIWFEIALSLLHVTGSFYLCKLFSMQPMFHGTHTWLNIYQIFRHLLGRLIIEQASSELSFFSLQLIRCCWVDICSVEAGKKLAQQTVSFKVKHVSMQRQGAQASPCHWSSRLQRVFEATHEIPNECGLLAVLQHLIWS